MYKVAVLLSTYNGSKYIKEQIDSILSQEGVNIDIYIRDEIALMLVDLFENKKLCVKIEEQDISELGYAPTLKINMDTNKIKSIGWKPKYTLQDAFVDLVDWMSSVSNDI